MLDDTPVPSRLVIVTDYTQDQFLGQQLVALSGHVLPGTFGQVYSSARDVHLHLVQNKQSPPILFNFIWPIPEHFDSPESMKEEVFELGQLIWSLEPLVIKGICHIVVIGIPGKEQIEYELKKLQNPDMETKRFSLKVEFGLEQSRPLGEPRQPPVSEYIEMGKMADAVSRLCLLWGNCFEASQRSRAKA